MSETRLPWFKFYPADWLKDPALLACSLAAQGAWMRLLCHMHESTPRGYLQDGNGQPFTDRQIARLIGCAPQTARKIVAELTSLGVVSVTEIDSQTPGVLYSRRMVRDDRKLQQDIENGRKGGNAALKKGLTPPLTTPSPDGLKLDSDTDVDTELENSSSVNQYPQQASSSIPGWEEVEDGLRRLKVSLIRKAIESAKEHGFNPPQVLALIGYLEANPSGCQSAKGAIFNRLVDQGADAVHWDADQHWPWSNPKLRNPRNASMHPQEELDIDAIRAAVPVSHPVDPEALAKNAAVRVEREQSAVDALEVRLGPELDRIPDTDLPAMCAASKNRSIDEAARDARSKLASYGRNDPRTRAALLKVLDVQKRKAVA